MFDFAQVAIHLLKKNIYTAVAKKKISFLREDRKKGVFLVVRPLKGGGSIKKGLLEKNKTRLNIFFQQLFPPYRNIISK